MGIDDRTKKVLEEFEYLHNRQQARAKDEEEIQQLEKQGYEHHSFTPKKTAEYNNFITKLDTTGAEYKIFHLGHIKHVLSKNQEIDQQFVES